MDLFRQTIDFWECLNLNQLRRCFLVSIRVSGRFLLCHAGFRNEVGSVRQLRRV